MYFSLFGANIWKRKRKNGKWRRGLHHSKLMESSLPPCISLRRRCALQSMREFIITRGIKKKSPAHDAIDIANNGSALSPPGVSDVCIPTSSLAADGIYLLLHTHTHIHTQDALIYYTNGLYLRGREGLSEMYVLTICCRSINLSRQYIA
jgi:hypothetical protein